MYQIENYIFAMNSLLNPTFHFQMISNYFLLRIWYNIISYFRWCQIVAFPESYREYFTRPVVLSLILAIWVLRCCPFQQKNTEKYWKYWKYTEKSRHMGFEVLLSTTTTKMCRRGLLNNTLSFQHSNCSGSHMEQRLYNSSRQTKNPKLIQNFRTLKYSSVKYLPLQMICRMQSIIEVFVSLNCFPRSFWPLAVPVCATSDLTLGKW